MLAPTEVLHLLELAQHAVHQADPDDTVVLPLLQALHEIVNGHGVSVATTLMALWPLALAKGDAKRQLHTVMDSYTSNDPVGMSVWLDPTAKKGSQSMVANTGRINLLHLMGQPSVIRGTN